MHFMLSVFVSFLSITFSKVDGVPFQRLNQEHTKTCFLWLTRLTRGSTEQSYQRATSHAMGSREWTRFQSALVQISTRSRYWFTLITAHHIVMMNLIGILCVMSRAVSAIDLLNCFGYWAKHRQGGFWRYKDRREFVRG